MTKTYNAKLVPMARHWYDNGDIVMSKNGTVQIAIRKGHNGGLYQFQAQRLIITSDDAIGSDEVQINTETNIISTFKAGGTNPFKEYKKVIAAYPAIPGVPQIDLSDIRRWIDEGCKESVELEVKDVFVSGSYINKCCCCKATIHNTDKMWFFVNLVQFYLPSPTTPLRWSGVNKLIMVWRVVL